MQERTRTDRSTGVGGLVRGLSAAARGFGSTMGNRDVRRAYVRLVLALLCATLALFAAMEYGWWQLTQSFPDGSWLAGLGVVLFVAGSVIVALAAPLLALMLINVVFPLFAEAVFFAGLRHVAPERARQLQALPGLPIAASVAVAVAVFIKFAALTLLAFAVSLIPVAGPVVGPVFQLWITAKTLGWELLDPFFDKRALRYRGQRDYVNSRSKAIVGFALPYSFLLAIPLIGPLFFGLAQAAAPVLLVDVLEPGA